MKCGETRSNRNRLCIDQSCRAWVCPVDVCVCTVPRVCVCVYPLSWDWVSFRGPIDPFQSEPSHEGKKKSSNVVLPPVEKRMCLEKKMCDATEKGNENQSRGSRKMTVVKIAVQSNLKRERRQAEEERRFFLQDHSPWSWISTRH